MNRRAARLAALLLWTLLVTLDVALVAPYQLDWYGLTHPFYEGAFRFGEDLVSVAFILVIPAYATLGAIIVALRPKNSIGWLSFLPSFLMVAVAWPPGLGTIADLMQSLAWYLMAPPLPITLMLLIFPDGRLLSRRWWAVVVVAAVGYVVTAFNVYLPAAYADVGLPASLGVWASLAALLASSIAVVLRWRRSRAQERRQMKWLGYVVVLTVLALFGTIVSGYVGDEQSYVTTLLSMAVVFGVALGIPVAVGVAILKYRLYDIDLLINRTLVYGSLTAVLIALYFGGTILLQRLFVLLTGQQSTLAIVASTLLIAALFNPLRRRVQALVDRRFYRRKYDATKTLAAFSTRLREETDLDSLRNEVLGVVRETMQPKHASLWLRSYKSDVKENVPG